MDLRSQVLDDLYRPLIRRTTMLLLKVPLSLRDKKRLIMTGHDAGIFSAGDVARLFSENELTGKDI